MKMVDNYFTLSEINGLMCQHICSKTFKMFKNEKGRQGGVGRIS